VTAPMRSLLRAGVAVYNSGRYHAAHDAWEGHWLDLEEGTDDERFLHGLIQFTAAVHHATEGNDSGATGLAESAVEYLADLPADYRGVNLADVRAFLDALAAEPAVLEEREPPQLGLDGSAIQLRDLDFKAVLVAAPAIAETDGYDEAVVERACEYAEADVDAGLASSPYVSLLFDFVREPPDRDVVYQRLSEHVERRTSRDEDVDGLFE